MSGRRTPAEPCDAFEDQLPELSLGILTGRRREDVLAHLDHCSRCATEVDQLSQAADGLLMAAPQAEPQVGFEVRLFERMRHDPNADAPPGTLALTPRPRAGVRRRAVLCAAAAAVVALVFLGGWLAGGGTSGPAPTVAARATIADLVSATGTVGTVTTLGGKPGWVVMNVTDVDWPGPLFCQVQTAHGAPVNVGTFWLSEGYGAWAARLPMPASQVHQARLVGAGGTVLATATL
jgi:hypothetical protein